ncbi:MAG: hypothetical protein ACK5LT_08175 [Lachnospirales bacterium]
MDKGKVKYLAKFYVFYLLLTLATSLIFNRNFLYEIKIELLGALLEAVVMTIAFYILGKDIIDIKSNKYHFTNDNEKKQLLKNISMVINAKAYGLNEDINTVDIERIFQPKKLRYFLYRPIAINITDNYILLNCMNLYHKRLKKYL